MLKTLRKKRNTAISDNNNLVNDGSNINNLNIFIKKPKIMGKKILENGKMSLGW